MSMKNSLRKELVPAKKAQLQAIGEGDLDERIKAAEVANDRSTLAVLVLERLRRAGLMEQYARILQARDIYKVHSKKLWTEGGYSSFAAWADEELGMAYSTAIAYVNVWAVYHQHLEWTIPEMSQAGVAKLTRMAAVARNVTADAPDEDLTAVLLDEEVPHSRVNVEYVSRRRQREAQRQLNDGNDSNTNRHHPSPPRYVFYPDTGRLVAYESINDGQDMEITLGQLFSHKPEAEEHIACLMERWEVKVR